MDTKKSPGDQTGAIPNSISVATKNDPSLRELVEYLDHMQRRVLQDALREAQRSYWLGRAADFRAALPKQSDWHGRSEGLAGVRRRRERLLAVIAACEAKAEASVWQDAS